MKKQLTITAIIVAFAFAAALLIGQTGDAYTQLTRDNAQEVVGDKATVIIFSLTTCPACAKLKADLPALEKEFPKVAFYVADLDKTPELTPPGLDAVPAIIFVKNKTIYTAVKGYDKAKLKKMIQELLNAK